MAVFGGVLFWAPKLWGRVVPELHSMPLVLLALGGTVLAAGPLIVAGFLDQVGGLPANDADVAAMLEPRLRQLGRAVELAVADRPRPDGARHAGVRRADAQGLHRCG